MCKCVCNMYGHSEPQYGYRILTYEDYKCDSGSSSLNDSCHHGLTFDTICFGGCSTVHSAPSLFAPPVWTSSRVNHNNLFLDHLHLLPATRRLCDSVAEDCRNLPYCHSHVYHVRPATKTFAQECDRGRKLNGSHPPAHRYEPHVVMATPPASTLRLFDLG